MLHDHELLAYVHRLELESASSILFMCRDGISSISLFHLHAEGVGADGYTQCCDIVNDDRRGSS